MTWNCLCHLPAFFTEHKLVEEKSYLLFIPVTMSTISQSIGNVLSSARQKKPPPTSQAQWMDSKILKKQSKEV